MKIRSEEIKMVPIEQIIPNPKNTNKHPPEQLERLKKIVEFQGFREPLVVSNRSGFLVCGHGRLEVAKSLGAKELPVIFQDFENEAMEFAHMTADNEIARWAKLDEELLKEELKTLNLEDIENLGIFDLSFLDEVEVVKIDEVEELPKTDLSLKPTTRKGDVWLMGEHRLMCGDSTMIDDVEKLTLKKTIDMVLTDPPYGISIVSKNGKVGGDNLAKNGIYAPVAGDGTIDVALEAIQVIQTLKPKKQIIWGGNYYSSSLENKACWIVWDKRDGMESNNFADCELAWTNMDSPSRVFAHRWSGMIKASERGESRVHPTQKPVALAEWCLDTYGNDCNIILDLFGGSGFTLIACHNKNKTCYTMELSENYCDVIVKRWEKISGKKATLESTGETFEDLALNRLNVESSDPTPNEDKD